MSSSTVGSGASPSSSFAHGKIAPGCLPYHSVVATGTTPSASSASCSRSPTTTIRFGADSIVVEPYLWSIVTGNAPRVRRRRPARVAGALLVIARAARGERDGRRTSRASVGFKRI